MIIGYPEGIKRVGRKRLMLPREPWFASKLRAEGFEDLAKDQEGSAFDWQKTKTFVRHAVDVHGLVWCKPGSVLGDIFHEPHREERFLHSFIGRHVHAASAKVVCVATFEHVVHVYSDIRGTNLKLRFDATYFSADLSQVLFSSGMLLADVLEAWGLPRDTAGEIPLLFQPEPVALLIMKQSFRTVYVLASQYMHRDDLRRTHVGFEDDVTAFRTLLERSKACMLPLDGDIQIDLDAVAGIASHLRRWAPLILGGGDADDDEGPVAQNRMHLRRCLLDLDALAGSLNEHCH